MTPLHRTVAGRGARANLVTAVGVLLLSLSSAGCLGSDDDPASPPAQRQASARSASTSGAGSIVVSERLDDAAVVVRVAELTDAGYLVLYDGESGAPGEVLGVSDHLTAGEHRDVRIRTDETRVRSAFVVVHRDGDANTSFDVGVDPAAGDGSGALAVRIDVDSDEREN